MNFFCQSLKKTPCGRFVSLVCADFGKVFSSGQAALCPSDTRAIMKVDKRPGFRLVLPGCCLGACCSGDQEGFF